MRIIPEIVKARRWSILLIVLSSGISILFGILLDHRSPTGTTNYRAIYYGARCVINHADPYQPDQFFRVYRDESGEFPPDPLQRRLFLRIVTICVNLPTALFLVAPLSFFAWGPSHVIWVVAIAISLVMAAILTYDIAQEFAPRWSLFLICLLMANCEVLFFVGNTAGLAVGLCVVAIWCFFRQRALWIGTICLAISLTLKPHDSGLVWAFLLLAGGSLRKNALLSLVFALALTVPAILWVSSASPRWSQELAANLATTSGQGDISDPGPTSISAKGSADVIIDLQTILSVFRDDPAFYNLASALICSLVFMVLFVAQIWFRRPSANPWYALASIVALTMLPTYHRPYDARLLLLAVPASAMLWVEGTRIARTTSIAIAAAIFLTGDVPLAILSILTKEINIASLTLPWKILAMPLVRPAPTILLILSVLCVIAFLLQGQQSQGKQVARLESLWGQFHSSRQS